MSQRLVGASVKRVEDPRLLTGRGRYVEDVVAPGMLHATYVRSPHAHARVVGVRTNVARALPGVVAVLTAADLRPQVRPLEPLRPPGLLAPAFSPLAEDTVRFVGDPVALVVAETRALAEDAVELVEVDYEPLRAVASINDALDPSFAPVFADLGTNVLLHTSHAYGDPDAAFARADVILRERFAQHRQAHVPLEGHAGLASYSSATGELVYRAAHQNPHALRVHLAALLGLPSHAVRVLCEDVGGSFGQKAYIWREDVVVCVASRLLDRPVRWVEERRENLLAGGQAREERIDVELAARSDGTLLGLRVHMVLDQGAYPITTLPSAIYPTLVRVLLPNAYRLRDYAFEATVVASNKASYLPYRGPWEMETWVRERLLDCLAHYLGLDPVDARLRNLAGDEDLARGMVTGPRLDGVTARRTLEVARDAVDYPAFRRAQAEARRHGRYLGIGFSTFVEPAPGPPSYTKALGASSAPRSSQRAVARLEPDGRLTIFTSQSPHGQSHETTLSQVAAAAFGLPLDHVRVVHGDTRDTPFNLVGTGGSRAATLASGAVEGAARVARDRVVRIAAEILEVAPQDLEVVDGVVRVAGYPDRAVSVADVARKAYFAPESLPADVDVHLEAGFDFAIPEGGWTSATHCCCVEVSPETGKVEVVRFVVVEDCGDLINPAVVDGQIAGGVVQGVGSVLFERAVYDETGQALAASLLDYALPRAADLPPIEIFHLPRPESEGRSYRGVGEGGAIGAPAAVSNAVEDALAPLGARVRDQFLPTWRVRELIEASQATGGFTP